MMEEKLKILYLEDNPDDAELVERMLRKENGKLELHRVDSREEFIAAIRSTAFDVILSDHSLPQFNSNEALRLCNLAHLKVPFILVTGTVSEEFAVKCLKQGADDYVLKSNLTRLPTAIANALRQRKLASDRLHAEVALRHQNEELSKINQELDSLVYSVSHNLRAPLSSVLGLLNLANLEEHPRHPEFDAYLKMIEKSVLKLDDTLKEILDYSRNARLEIARDCINLKELCDDCMEKLAFLEGNKEIEIRSSFSGMEIPLYSDAYRLSMILTNMLSNAIKYRDKSKEQQYIHINAKITSCSLTIDFEDNGIGIQPALTGKIFNMFFRGTELSEGAGLGLYIVKQTVDKLNGRILVSSNPGKGTTFTVHLPNNQSGR